MPRDVWLVFPGLQRALVAPALKRLRTACSERGWRFEETPTRPLEVRAGTWNLVSQEQAQTLYRRAHRTRTAVVSIGSSAQVCLASESDLRRGLGSAASVVLTLSNYVRYKALFVSLRTADDPLRWVGAFDRWCDGVHCEGEYDPRCLPFHIFRTETKDLDTAGQRSLFDDRHGHATRRCDDERRQWRLNPHAFHGIESLSVAGRQLPTAYHWDVAPEAGRTTRIRTPTEEWSVETYINVYPDGGLRVTKEGRARRFR